MEREKKVLHEEESCCNNFQTDMASGSISDTNMPGASYIEDVGFGIRKRHRCYVVTARARSFLYHQVCVNLSSSCVSEHILVLSVYF